MARTSNHDYATFMEIVLGSELHDYHTSTKTCTIPSVDSRRSMVRGFSLQLLLEQLTRCTFEPLGKASRLVGDDYYASLAIDVYLEGCPAGQPWARWHQECQTVVEGCTFQADGALQLLRGNIGAPGAPCIIKNNVFHGRYRGPRGPNEM